MVDNAPVLVTGGTGSLGRAVVTELRARSVPVRSLSRHPHPEDPDVVRGDLSTGDGLQEAVLGARAVIHCATNAFKSRAVDVDGTRRLLDLIEGVSPEAHLVYISIVGCADNPLPYYRVKVAAEELVAAAAGRHRASIVRATQFHQLVRVCSKLPPKGPVALAARDLRFEPCDTSFVARHLVEVALGEPLTTPREVAGPKVLTLHQAIRLTAQAEHRRPPRQLTLPAVGGILRRFAQGSNLAGPGAERGGSTYAEWLATAS